MGLTNFPHGIFATPLIGAGRLSDIWASDNIYFVNGEASGNGTGLAVESPVKLISTAVGYASKDAVIYVKPQTTTASAQAYYRDNIVIPKTKPNISIIGCGAGNSNPNSYTGVQLKVATTDTASHLFDVNGAGLYLENMRLTGNSMTGTTASIINGNGSATESPHGLHVRGCLFEGCLLAGSLGDPVTRGAITLGTCTYSLFEDNTFYNCLSGIGMIGNYGTGGRITIRNNMFSGAPGSRDWDIQLYPGSGTYGSGVEIIGNIFSDGLPNTGAIKRFIKIVSTGSGIVADNFFASTAASGAAQWGAAGTQCIIPVSFFFAGNYANDGHMVAY